MKDSLPKWYKFGTASGNTNKIDSERKRIEENKRSNKEIKKQKTDSVKRRE